MHKKYDVDPDMAMFGKALVTAIFTSVIGRRAVMEQHNQHLSVAPFGQNVLDQRRSDLYKLGRDRLKSATETGQYVRQRWQDLADSIVFDYT